MNFLSEPKYASRGTYVLGDWHDNLKGSLHGLNYTNTGQLNLLIDNFYGYMISFYDSSTNIDRNYASGFWVPRFSYAEPQLAGPFVLVAQQAKFKSVKLHSAIPNPDAVSLVYVFYFKDLSNTTAFDLILRNYNNLSTFCSEV